MTTEIDMFGSETLIIRGPFGRFVIERVKRKEDQLFTIRAGGEETDRPVEVTITEKQMKQTIGWILDRRFEDVLLEHLSGSRGAPP